MKKKLLALVCALVMIFSLASCGLSTPDTVGKVGDFEVSSGLYLLAQFSAYQQAAQLAAKVRQFLGFQLGAERSLAGLGIVQQEQIFLFQFVQQCLRIGSSKRPTHHFSAHGCGTIFVIWHCIHLFLVWFFCLP